jgi:pyruvate dehydrogenase E2 component (dihydrolipoamide acetyltransferase)
MIDVRMPKLSDNMEEGIIIRWMKAPGDHVAKGEPLAEVETDKADVELEASDSGVLREIRIPQGQSAAVGAVIAVLGADNETAETDGQGASRADAESAGAAGAARASRPASEATPAARARAAPPVEKTRPMGQAQGKELRTVARTEPAERAVRASPLAWRMADDAGVNLASVRGSGPGGRILKRDVEASVRGSARPLRGDAGTPSRKPDVEAAGAEVRDDAATEEQDGAAAEADGGESGPAQAAGDRMVPATRMRVAIAKRMAEAKRDIPHFYVAAEIDMSEAMHLRESIKRREAMPGLTVTHLLLRALAIALVRHPRVNASWRDDAIEVHDDVNLGIAVAVEDGLIVPVLRRAQTLSLGEIVARASELTAKARSGKFGSADLTGGTFSLSNVGMLDVDELVAVINPPQAAILAVAAVKDRPVVRDGQLAVAKTMRATLSCDHRVLNGVEGGRFLAELRDILEHPVTLLLDDAPPARQVEGSAPAPPTLEGDAPSPRSLEGGAPSPPGRRGGAQ